VFTKFDMLFDIAFGELRKTPGLTRKDLFERAPQRAEEIFAHANIWGRLCGTRHPPKNYVRLARKLTPSLSSVLCVTFPTAEMNVDETDCGPLLECTMGALGDEALQRLLMSTQRTNLELCIMFAVKKSFFSLLTWTLIHLTLLVLPTCSVAMAYIKRACQGSLRVSEDECILMQKEIAKWFPHTGVS
jgi:hypothetical protein